MRTQIQQCAGLGLGTSSDYLFESAFVCEFKNDVYQKLMDLHQPILAEKYGQICERAKTEGNQDPFIHVANSALIEIFELAANGDQGQLEFLLKQFVPATPTNQ